MRQLALALLFLTACSTATPAPSNHATVLFFITTDCPIANSFAPEIKRIIAEYGARGLASEVLYADATVTDEAMKRHATEYGYTGAHGYDQGRSRCRQYGITVTPEAVLLNPDGTRAYRGRIDDRYLAPGNYRLQPTTRELRDAIEAVLAGRPVPVAETKAAGCPLTE